MSSTTQEKSPCSYVDIGANLLDEMYQGSYRGKQRHDADLDLVLQRAWENNLDRIIITAGTLEESQKALELAKSDTRLLIFLFLPPHLPFGQCHSI